MISTNEAYIKALRSLHSAMSDYLLLVGEPCPLLGQLCMRFVEMIGSLPAGDELQANSLSKLATVILEAAILGVIDRIEQLSNKGSEACVPSLKNCMAITDTLSPQDRCDVFFKVLGMAMTSLRGLTNQEYPQLTDGEGKKL